jgi:hypothetical protein
MFQTIDDVYTWLFDRTDGEYGPFSFIGGYARSGAFMKKRAPLIKEFAHLMRSYPDLIYEMFRWGSRTELIANVIVIVEQLSEFEEQQALGIIRGSWVAPQLAAGFALTTDGTSIPVLEAYLSLTLDEQQVQYPKQILSTYAALKLLGSKKADEFDQRPLFTEFLKADRDNSLELALGFYKMGIWQNEYGLSLTKARSQSTDTPDM